MKRTLALLLCLIMWPVYGSSAGVPWLHDDSAAFARAKADHRYVLLYLEAVWCHWCHVMDHDTYGDAEIAQEIAAHYVPLRIDQDARPDLANRYRNYGWPATVVFAADGTEIVKRRGYVAPERFLRLLRAIVADPSPETNEAASEAATAVVGGQLDTATRAELQFRHRRTDDAELGGLKTDQKFLDRDSVEYALVGAAADDSDEAAIARRSLDAARALFDPVWGGVYQYSTDGDWQHPHFEKLATLQAEYLRIYALAWAALHRVEDRAAVLTIRNYLDAFLLAPDGGYYVSQDADLKPGEHSAEFFALDDAGRRARGIPRVDRHRYAQQTSAVAEALATWAEVSGDTKALTQAQAALRWVQSHRSRKQGGFRHDDKDDAGPYLADQLAVGRAALALYRADADRRWLTLAGNTADFIAMTFKDPAGGFVGAVSQGPIKAARQLDENLALARFATLLAHYSGQSAHRAIGEHALRWLAQPNVALSRLTEAGLLQADAEFSQDPLHVVVVGDKSDANAKVLFSSLQQLPGWYKRLEWWDRDEGPLPYADVEYPKLKRAAAFVCTSQRCSLPLYTPREITDFLAARDAQG